MSLSERLAAAARARGEDVPLPPPPPAPEPEPEPDPRLIVMRPFTPATAVEPDPDADLESTCPTCGRRGEVAVVDLARRTTDWACDVCGTMWRVTMPPPSERPDGQDPRVLDPSVGSAP